VALIYSGSVSATYSSSIAALTAASYRDSFGTAPTLSAVAVAPEDVLAQRRTEKEDEAFALRVFAGSYATILGVILLTIALQYVFLPPTLAAITDSGPASRIEVNAPGIGRR
jgi:hypothetical protein